LNIIHSAPNDTYTAFTQTGLTNRYRTESLNKSIYVLSIVTRYNLRRGQKACQKLQA